MEFLLGNTDEMRHEGQHLSIVGKVRNTLRLQLDILHIIRVFLHADEDCVEVGRRNTPAHTAHLTEYIDR